MKISYKWLNDYMPVTVEPERLSVILTSIGLEVESFEKYEEIKGGLKGLIIGKVLHTEKHPNADKLTLTRVDIGDKEPLSIVCGAPNVAAGQKVIIAPVRSTIYPIQGEPMTMKIAKIRNVESHGMICAEDEIGIGSSHEGILVLPDDAVVGSAAADLFQPYDDIVYEIGLTPNRMEAMSHWGVARDVCAWLSHHEKKNYQSRLPMINEAKPDDHSLEISVKVENKNACPRYSGLTLTGISIGASPRWMQQKLKAIGIRPINNIVDITNFIQHETGQPLHAFDADALQDHAIIVRNLPAGTPFITLDEKERKLNADDLMICDGKGPVCIAGVFGGLHSGVTGKTRNLFLESACFDAVAVRKTSFSHGLRTDAASRFEKGTDISATVNVLKRAAGLIKEIAGGKISSDIVDIYPDPKEKTKVTLRYNYLQKLSGKLYQKEAVKSILGGLGFEWISDNADAIQVAVPYHKPDISLPADLVEEILRIDGLDNIDIPETISMTPSIEENLAGELLKEKISGYLASLGFHEIITNSITKSSYYPEAEQQGMVKMLNSLNADLNILRNSLFESGLEVVAHNLNHKNNSLRLFEMGKAYGKTASGKYEESEKLSIIISGKTGEENWKNKPASADFFYLKGIVTAVLKVLGLEAYEIEPLSVAKLENHIVLKKDGNIIAGMGEVKQKVLQSFGIKQPVFFAGLNWALLVRLATDMKTKITEVPRYPSVQRDLAMFVSTEMTWEKVEKSVQKIGLDKLRSLKLFDIFESEKLGAGKKSMAMNFTFRDEEKTLTDKEIDEWMKKIMQTLEKELPAEIRK